MAIVAHISSIYLKMIFIIKTLGDPNIGSLVVQLHSSFLVTWSLALDHALNGRRGGRPCTGAIRGLLKVMYLWAHGYGKCDSICILTVFVVQSGHVVLVPLP